MDCITTSTPRHFERLRAIVERGAGLSGVAFRVLVALEYHADGSTGDAWPSVTRLASYVGNNNRRHVQRGLRELETTGWILPMKRGGGRSNPTVFRVTVPAETVANSATVSRSVKGGGFRRETVANLGANSGGNRHETVAESATRTPSEPLNELPTNSKAVDAVKNFITTTCGLTYTKAISNGIARYGWTLEQLRAMWKQTTGATPAGTMRLRIMAAAIADGVKVVRRDTSDPRDLNPMTGEPWPAAVVSQEMLDLVNHPERSMSLSGLVELFRSLEKTTQAEMLANAGLTAAYDPASDDQITRWMFKSFADLREKAKGTTPAPPPPAEAGRAAAQRRKVQFLANLDAQKSEGTQP
jgi:hypothetical protein